MTMIDAGASVRLSAGAGRWQDFIWPDPLQTVSTASAVTQCRNRLLNVTVSMAVGGFGGGNPTLQALNNAALGVPVVQVGAGAADGIGQLARYNNGTAPGIFVNTTKGHGVPAWNDPLGVSRIWANYAYSAFGGGGTIDSGLQISASGGLMVSQTTAGMAFFRRGDGIISASAIAVGGGAASAVDVTAPATFNDQLLHSYEIQVVSATKAAEAQCNWLIDGVVVRTLNWGAGTVLPVLTGVQSCFTALLPNLSKNTNILVQRFCIATGPTVQDTL